MNPEGNAPSGPESGVENKKGRRPPSPPKTDSTEKKSSPPPAEKSDKTLVEKVSTFSLLLAVFVFLVNMILAWWVTFDGSEMIGRPLIEEGKETAVGKILESADEADTNKHILLNRVLDTELMLRTAQNRHTVTVVGMSAAFALFAVGFALFVMGAEGAFKLKGSVADQGNLVVKATAPGILCFVLATLVICFALASRVDLRTSTFDLDSNRVTPEDSGQGGPGGFKPRELKPLPGENTSDQGTPPN